VEPKSFLAESLVKLMSQAPGRISLLMSQGLTEEKLTQIQNYLRSINVPIV